MWSVGDLSEIRRRYREQSKKKAPQVVEEVVQSEEESESDEEPIQTFPVIQTDTIIRQKADDLTCGIRCLQNMYGRHIVTRAEMDACAKELEGRAFGVKMYTQDIGFYHIEVIVKLLSDKGKYVQRIDQKKIPSNYYRPVIAMNPSFAGYIVAIGSEELKHYVAIRFKKNTYIKIDSLPGVQPLVIPKENLFQSRKNGQIFCSESCKEPVVAILAVGGAPFVEYSLLHRSWPAAPPPASRYCSAIDMSLNLVHSPQYARPWFKKWKTIRIEPDENTYRYLSDCVTERISDVVKIVVKMQDQQTILPCKTAQGLMQKLTSIGWIDSSSDFCMSQNNKRLTLEFNSQGPLSSFGVTREFPVIIEAGSVSASQAQVGGFYRFNCSVTGKCVGVQRNSYSVRDAGGKIHVVYKNSIEQFEMIKQ